MAGLDLRSGLSGSVPAVDRFRVATLNIWSRFGPWEERLPALRSAIGRERPHVLGMQEVLRADGFDQGDLVLGGLGYELVWGKASDNHGFPMGNAVASLWPIVESELLVLPHGGTDERRSALWALLDAPFGRVSVVVTHLNWKLDESHVRVLQVRALDELVRAKESERNLPVILLGDFNAEPDSDEIRFLRGRTALGGLGTYYNDAFDYVHGPAALGPTYSKQNPFAAYVREPERRIDYVFTRGPDDRGRCTPLSARVAFDAAEGGTFPSDHFGVVAELAVGR